MSYSAISKRPFRPIFGIILLMLCGFAIFSSCRKERVDQTSPVEILKLDDVLYSPDFDWSSSQVIEVEVIGSERKTINITSTDGQIRYNIGQLTGEDDVYNVKISLPKKVESILINRDTVSVTAQINHTIS